MTRAETPQTSPLRAPTPALITLARYRDILWPLSSARSYCSVLSCALRARVFDGSPGRIDAALAARDSDSRGRVFGASLPRDFPIAWSRWDYRRDQTSACVLQGFGSTLFFAWFEGLPLAGGPLLLAMAARGVRRTAPRPLWVNFASAPWAWRCSRALQVVHARGEVC